MNSFSFLCKKIFWHSTVTLLVTIAPVHYFTCFQCNYGQVSDRVLTWNCNVSSWQLKYLATLSVTFFVSLHVVKFECNENLGFVMFCNKCHTLGSDDSTVTFKSSRIRVPSHKYLSCLQVQHTLFKMSRAPGTSVQKLLKKNMNFYALAVFRDISDLQIAVRVRLRVRVFHTEHAL